MLWISLFTFGAALFVFIQWFAGIRKLPVLYQQKPNSDAHESVSIIVAAKNEEARIYEAVESMLDLEYPQLEVIVVNDRSSDTTLEKLTALQENHAFGQRLQIHTIKELPDGWLGKNHAMYQGSRLASHEWLLFTDADIIYEPDTLRKTMAYAINNTLDHVTLIPQNEKGTFFYRAFHSYWSILGVWNFIQLRHAGIGAFNLIRNDVYQSIGTHNALALAPDDDLKLGKRIVSMGFKQQLGFGRGMIRVQWYENIPQLIQGLEKNLFAFMRFSITAVIFFSLLIFTLHVLPFISLFSLQAASGYFFTATVIIYFVMYLINQKYAGDQFLFFILMPVNGILFIYCLLRSAFVTVRRGGIEWKGTIYSLRELRRKKQ